MIFYEACRRRYLQESTRKCDDEFVGSFDEVVFDIHPVCYELILGSDGVWLSWMRRRANGSLLNNVLAILGRENSVLSVEHRAPSQLADANERFCSPEI